MVAEDSSSSSGSELASEDSCDEDEQQVAAAPHFLENLLSLGGYAVAKNKSSRLQHVLKQESGRLLCGKPFTDNFAVSASVDGSASSCRTCKTFCLATVLKFCVSGTSHHRGHLTASVRTVFTVSLGPSASVIFLLHLTTSLSCAPRLLKRQCPLVRLFLSRAIALIFSLICG